MISELENSKKQVLDLKKYYNDGIEEVKRQIFDEKARNLDCLEEISTKTKAKNSKILLMNQHLGVCSRYFGGKLNDLREIEENLAMKCEDLCVQKLVASNHCKVVKNQHKKLKKIMGLIGPLEEKRQQNNFFIQKYSGVLKKAAKIMENKNSIDFFTKVSEINNTICGLQRSIEEFTQEALEDPRKMIPYIRSASPMRVPSGTNY